MEALGVSQGASEFRRGSSEMDTPLVPCAEEGSYQRLLAALLVTWRRDKAVLTVLEVAFFCLG